MTTTDSYRATLLSGLPVRHLDWRAAGRALRALIADPERTEQVFEITRALSGRADVRNVRRFLDHPDGLPLLAARPSLLAALSDRAALARLPAGSFGGDYLAFMESAELSADGLVDASMQGGIEAREGYGPEVCWFFDRLRDMHDLWHVLTGYGRDEAGEAANLAFTFGQIGNAGIGIIVLAGAVLGPRSARLQWERYLYRAWRRGRQAAWLPAVRYEELLALPLTEVRAMLRIAAPEIAHPEGIVVANRHDGTAAGPAPLGRVFDQAG